MIPIGTARLFVVKNLKNSCLRVPPRQFSTTIVVLLKNGFLISKIALSGDLEVGIVLVNFKGLSSGERGVSQYVSIKFENGM